MQTRFANPNAIRAQHSGASILLAHFHYLNKGGLPFAVAEDISRLRKLFGHAELTETECEFIRNSALLVRERSKYKLPCLEMRLLTIAAHVMKMVQQDHAFGHDFFWISQLYEKDWRPGFTA